MLSLHIWRIISFRARSAYMVFRAAHARVRLSSCISLTVFTIIHDNLTRTSAEREETLYLQHLSYTDGANY